MSLRLTINEAQYVQGFDSRYESRLSFRSAHVANKTPSHETPSRALARNAADPCTRAAAMANETLLPIIGTDSASDSAVAARSRDRPLAASLCFQIGEIFSASGTEGSGPGAHCEHSIAALP